MSTWGLPCTIALLGLGVYKFIQVPFANISFSFKAFPCQLTQTGFPKHQHGSAAPSPLPWRPPSAEPELPALYPHCPCCPLFVGHVGGPGLPQIPQIQSQTIFWPLLAYLLWLLSSCLDSIPIHTANRTITDPFSQAGNMEFFPEYSTYNKLVPKSHKFY